MVTRLCVLAALLLASVAAQNSLYSAGGCRITTDSSADPAAPVNVTCTCAQFVAQTDRSAPIEELTVTGCTEAPDPGSSPPITVISFTLPRRRRLGSRDFILTDVRSVTLSRGRFRLLAVSQGALSHPLRKLSVSQAEIAGGLTDGALAGLPELRHVLFTQVDITAMRQSALSDLPQLRTLQIVDSSCTFVNQRVVMGVPRLRQLILIRNELQFVRSNAFDVERSAAVGPDGADPCPQPVSGALTEPSATGATVFIVGNDFHSMSREAFMFSGYHHVVFTNNSVGDMGERSLVATFQSSLTCPVSTGALFQFTDNELTDMRQQAVAVTNTDVQPISLLLGGNALLQAALSPRQLNLTGPFLPSDQFALQNPNRYACECCDCANTMDLLDLALNATEEADDPIAGLFTDAILTARCANGDKSFGEFADSCQSGLTARLRGETPRTPAAPGMDGAAPPLAPTAMVVVVFALVAGIWG